MTQSRIREFFGAYVDSVANNDYNDGIILVAWRQTLWRCSIFAIYLMKCMPACESGRREPGAAWKQKPGLFSLQCAWLMKHLSLP
jgi:hypothetical protein